MIPIFTLHAQSRCVQRGIPAHVVDILIRHGRHEFDKPGSEIAHAHDARASARVGERLAALGMSDKYRNAYAIIKSDEQVVLTVGRLKERRIRRDRTAHRRGKLVRARSRAEWSASVGV